MKKLFTILLLGSLASVPSSAQEIIDSQCEQEIYDCFVSALDGGEADTVVDAVLSHDDISSVREKVWGICIFLH